MNLTTVIIPYNPPLNWPFLLTFINFHQVSGIETVSKTTYERVFEIGDQLGFVQIACDRQSSTLIIKIWHDNNELVPIVIQKIQQIFNLNIDLDQLIPILFQHPELKKLWLQDPGVRIARGWNEFEIVTNTILGQLISTQQAQKLMAQIAQHCGKSILHPYYKTKVYLFPGAAELAKTDLNFLGITKMKKTAIIDISQRIASRQINLSTSDFNSLRNDLLNVPGIGNWSAEYILLRLGHTDAFPKTDLILKRAMQHFPDLKLEKFKPWRSYVALCLWKYYIELSSGHPKINRISKV